MGFAVRLVVAVRKLGSGNRDVQKKATGASPESRVWTSNILPRRGRRIGATGSYKHTAPQGQADRGYGFLQTYCPAGAGGSGLRVPTNILPRRGRRIGATVSYKHTAPQGQADRGYGFLQTFCPAGAGGSGLRVPTNILPRRGRRIGATGSYKHSAPQGQA